MSLLNVLFFIIIIIIIIIIITIIISSDRSSYSGGGLLYVRSHFLRFRAFLPIYLVFLFKNGMQINNN